MSCNCFFLSGREPGSLPALYYKGICFVHFAYFANVLPLLIELVIVFGWTLSRIVDELAGQRMLLWARVLRVIEVHQHQKWQVTLQMTVNHHPGQTCLNELLVVSSYFFLFGFVRLTAAWLLHSQAEEATRYWWSRVMKRLLMFHMNCCKTGLSHMKDVHYWYNNVFINRSSDTFVDIVYCLNVFDV